ncbi:hypothetical protein IEQ34_005556 [Dendrobium chrysotoxum]|uniref:Uncharacterized protein n=1 Tax=Dendrobium chrysotoxum TaxID=161865 RepID=A0AAV7HDF2_DENCH|nr:hypothetical protein IEQ34_005556 [Dendrobium chrysotoxum]
MEDNKSFPEEEISTRKETTQPAEVTGNGSINGDSVSPSSPSKNLEVLAKESSGEKLDGVCIMDAGIKNDWTKGYDKLTTTQYNPTN